jgi:uncharacterized protein (TIGR03083 family)
MYLTIERCVAEIDRHTRGLAEAATGHLDRRIAHCPGWTMADLVWHLTGVHWFWNHVASSRPTQEPSDLERLERPVATELVATLLSGVETLTATLRSADQDSTCWTWGLEQNVGFITRHQVQEAAVHHWDALDAVGRSSRWSMDPVAAIDSVEEFLTESVANRRWPKADVEPMRGTIWFCPCFADTAICPTWHIHDGEARGTVAFESYEGEAPEIDGLADGDHVDPAALLLWLYRRVPDSDIDSMGRFGARRPLLERFRAFTETD